MPMPMNQPQPQAPQTSEQMGAVPQAQAMAGKPQGGAPSPQDLEFFRNGDPEIKQAIEMFVGHPVDMKLVPDQVLVQIAGMVHKLGVQGAVAMAQKTIPPQVQQQIKSGK